MSLVLFEETKWFADKIGIARYGSLASFLLYAFVMIWSYISDINETKFVTASEYMAKSVYTQFLFFLIIALAIVSSYSEYIIMYTKRWTGQHKYEYDSHKNNAWFLIFTTSMFAILTVIYYLRPPPEDNVHYACAFFTFFYSTIYLSTEAFNENYNTEKRVYLYLGLCFVNILVTIFTVLNLISLAWAEVIVIPLVLLRPFLLLLCIGI